MRRKLDGGPVPAPYICYLAMILSFGDRRDSNYPRLATRGFGGLCENCLDEDGI